MPTEVEKGVDNKVRRIKRRDAAAIAAIDALHTGELKSQWWQEVIARHTRRGATPHRVGLVALDSKDGEVIGYVLGQVRAFEFGSEPCGWIYSVGVHPDHLRSGAATKLFLAAKESFQENGVGLIRTMVRRDNVAVLTFFRNQGFALGPYSELELAL